MKKKILCVAIGLLVIVILSVTVAILSNPMRKSEEEIRAYFLEKTPVGTEEKQAIEIIEENAQKYSNHRNYEKFSSYQQLDYGFAIIDDRVALRYHGDEYDDSDMIGNKTIRAVVGKYNKIFGVTVFACWAFDENGKLVDIGVYKEFEGF